MPVGQLSIRADHDSQPSGCSTASVTISRFIRSPAWHAPRPRRCSGSSKAP